MQIKRCRKPSFSVIGKEGSTDDGNGFIKELWIAADHYFHEVLSIAKKDKSGQFVGFWGLMSDMSKSFKPWEDHYSKGYYLAGIEVEMDAIAPKGWVKWTVPSYDYLYVESQEDTFMKMIQFLDKEGIELVGAVHDHTDPITQKSYMYFPIEKLNESI